MIDNLDSLNKTIHDMQTELKTNGVTASKVEKMVGDLREEVQTLRVEAQASQAKARASVHESDHTIEREYFENQGTGRVARSLGGVSYDGVKALGSDSGKVRLLGEDVDGDYRPGLLDDPAPKSDWHRELQSRAQAIGLYRMMTGEQHAPVLTRRFLAHAKRGPAGIAKVFADNAAEGAEFIPDVTLPEVFATMRSPVSLASQFRRRPLPTGGSTVNPFVTSGLQPFIAGVPALGDLNPAELVKSVPVTTSISTSPKTIAVVMPANRDATEDSIIEWQSFAAEQIGMGLANGEEDALINGDTAGSHQDAIASWAGPTSMWTTLGHANDHRKAWIGLRARAFDVSATADGSGAQTVVGTIAWRAALSGACRQLDGLLYVMPIGFTIAKLLVDTNFLTLEKAGVFATNFTGQIGFIGGIPVHISDFLTEDLNASGLFDNVTLDYTAGLLVQTKRCEFAERRGARVEVDVQPLRHTAYHVASIRETFRYTSSATEKNVYCAYKLAKA